MDFRKYIFYGAFLTGIIGFAGAAGCILANRQNTNVVRRNTDSSIERTVDVDETEEVLGARRDRFDGSIIYKDKRYEVNTSIDKVLFLGIDTSDQEREGIGIDEGGRSDTIILFIIDNERKLITPLEINRDTMMDIDIYDNDGKFLSRGEKQLAMQYAYGDTVQKACSLTKEKVSTLLGRTRIDSVVSLTMEGIEPIVDSIGGVTLKLTSDETDLDPFYSEGAIIHLDGDKAKAFIHDRDVETRGSNIDRMSRQTQFMLALFQNIKGKGNEVIGTMEEAAGEYLYEDIDADSVNHFTEYDYSGDVVMLPGENVNAKLHDEFYVDEEKLTEVILNLFYKCEE